MGLEIAFRSELLLSGVYVTGGMPLPDLGSRIKNCESQRRFEIMLYMGEDDQVYSIDKVRTCITEMGDKYPRNVRTEIDFRTEE
jgi:hypothetical protein